MSKQPKRILFSHLFQTFPVAAVIGFGLFAIHDPPAVAQETRRETEIPIPNPIKTTAIKGQKVTIELTSIARTRASTVEFLIRDRPKGGKIGRMVSNNKDRTKATIEYTPDRGTAATTDSFTFAVRYYPDGLFSRPAKVEIELGESEPTITVTNIAEFGKVMLGKSATREIFVRNSGNAGYNRKVELPEPWSIVEPASGLLNVPIGGNASMKIRFTPTRPGQAEHLLNLHPNPGATSHFNAFAYSPFQVKTPEVYLTWDQTARLRTGEIELEIHSPEMLPATVRPGDERIRIDGGLSRYLQPGKPNSIRAYLPTSDSAPYQGTIEITAGSFKLPVKLMAAPPPAYLVVSTGSKGGDGVIDFGVRQPGETAQSSFVVQNIGGAETKVAFGTEDPFQVLAAGGGSTLSPGESEAFAVRLLAPRKEDLVFDNALKISADTGQLVQIRLKAVVQRPVGEAPNPNLATLPNSFGTSKPAVPGNGRPAGDSPDMVNGDFPPDPLAPVVGKLSEPISSDEQVAAFLSPLGFITVPLVDREISPEIPPVGELGMKLDEQGLNHLEISWELPRADLVQFEMERRGTRTNPETNSSESVWVPYHDVDYERNGDRMVAIIRGLNSNELCEFRVFTLSGDGRVSPPVAFFSNTKPLMDWTWIYVGTGVLLLAGLGTLAWRRFGRLLTR